MAPAEAGYPVAQAVPAAWQTAHAPAVVPQASQAMAGLGLPAQLPSAEGPGETFSHAPVVVPQAAQAMADAFFSAQLPGVEHPGESFSYSRGGAPAFILVRLGATPLVAGPRPFREFELTISVGGVDHSLRARFSALERGLAPFATAEILASRQVFLPPGLCSQ